MSRTFRLRHLPVLRVPGRTGYRNSIALKFGDASFNRRADDFACLDFPKRPWRGKYAADARWLYETFWKEGYTIVWHREARLLQDRPHPIANVARHPYVGYGAATGMSTRRKSHRRISIGSFRAAQKNLCRRLKRKQASWLSVFPLYREHSNWQALT